MRRKGASSAAAAVKTHADMRDSELSWVTVRLRLAMPEMVERQYCNCILLFISSILPTRIGPATGCLDTRTWRTLIPSKMKTDRTSLHTLSVTNLLLFLERIFIDQGSLNGNRPGHPQMPTRPDLPTT